MSNHEEFPGQNDTMPVPTETPKFYRHFNGQVYKFLHYGQMKLLGTHGPHSWVDAVIYQDANGNVYCREISSFYEHFHHCPEASDSF
jgi:hypothetical protein